MLKSCSVETTMFEDFTCDELFGPLNEVEKRHSPERLYLAGDRAIFDINPRVSVVGSRKASALGIKRASKISRILVESGAVVVSGLAEGIDRAAHQAAIENGGRTIAVLGTPLDKEYPKSNALLQRLIMQEHCAVSQYPVGYPTMPKNFILRNRTMALISCASIIVEASDSSGALSQGWETLRLGRLLFISESLFHETSLKWPHEMLKYGAQILSEENLASFLEFLPVGKISDYALAF